MNRWNRDLQYRIIQGEFIVEKRVSKLIVTSILSFLFYCYKHIPRLIKRDCNLFHNILILSRASFSTFLLLYTAIFSAFYLIYVHT